MLNKKLNIDNQKVNFYLFQANIVNNPFKESKKS